MACYYNRETHPTIRILEICGQKYKHLITCHTQCWYWIMSSKYHKGPRNCNKIILMWHNHGKGTPQGTKGLCKIFLIIYQK